ncbi:MAG: DUF4226 domain-containing protein [Mycobacterium sp.]
MATATDVLAAIEHVTQCTGNPKAWLTGLTAQDATDVVTIFAASPQRLDGVLARIRQQHPDLFNPTTGEMIFPPPSGPAGHPPTNPRPDEPAPDRQEGDAADAIRDAEVALAHQNSATAQLDLQVITAVLNAHQKTAEGGEALNALQHDIEAAVRTRSDLDTPAGARDFQRFLVGKLRDIRAVVAGASLDNTSTSALMAAWTSLYNSAKAGDDDTGEHRPSTAGSAGPPVESAGQSRPAAPDAGMGPYLDSLPADDPGWLPEDMPAQIPSEPPPMPNIPSFGGGAMPGGGALPGATPGWAVPSGFPLSESRQGTDDERSPKALDDALLGSDDDQPSSDTDSADQPEAGEPTGAADPPAIGPTTVTLPNGETVTAASPQLAEAIKAAAGGVPIADAFRQQGITIPPPGTAVTEPVDPSRVAPGDIGMFTNRHALALGQSRALLNGQIQHISTVTGPSFLGWEHPPAPVTAVAPARTEPPAPTRPAATGRP